MYIQFKEGFIEADRWDGSRDQLPSDHLRAIDACGSSAVIVVRSRERQTIDWVMHSSGSSRRWFRTPEWDYEFRVYLPVAEWSAVLTSIATNLDYRNFKSWCHRHATTARCALAHEIWEQALITGQH